MKSLFKRVAVLAMTAAMILGSASTASAMKLSDFVTMKSNQSSAYTKCIATPESGDDATWVYVKNLSTGSTKTRGGDAGYPAKKGWLKPVFSGNCWYQIKVFSYDSYGTKIHQHQYYSARSPRITSFVRNSIYNTRITLRWKKVPGSSGYAIYRKYGKYGSWKKLATTTALSYLTGNQGTSNDYYYYTVKAYKKIGGKTYYSSIDDYAPGRKFSYNNSR